LDHDWLKPDQVYVATDLPFNQLVDGNNWRQYASTFNLIAGAQNKSLDSGASVSVTIHKRLMQPVLDMLVLFLGLPVVLARESRNAFIAVGSTMLIVTLFVIISLAFHSMGMYYRISPSLAVWSPLLIFVPIAVLMSGPLYR
jgi:lipopolysaccharide export system permease protein